MLSHILIRTNDLRMELDQVECKYGETYVYKKWALMLRWSFSGQNKLSGQAYNAVFEIEGR